MKKAIDILSFLLLCAVALVYLVSVQIAGGRALDALLYGATFAITIPFQGYFLLHKTLQRDNDTAFLFLAGTPVAIANIFVNFIVCDTIHLPRLCLLLPLALGICGIIDWAKHHKWAFFTTSFDRTILLVTGSAFLFFYCFMGVLSFAKASEVGRFFYHQDMLWSVGNAASVYNGFPLQDMRLANTTLNYHFLNDAIAGILGMALHIPAYESLCFYYTPYMMAGLIFGIYTIAKHIGNNGFLAACMPFLLLFVASTVSQTPINYFANMNGQTSASFMLCGLLLLCNDAVQQEKFSVPHAILLFASFTVAILYKSTIGALFLCALCAAAIVYALMHKAKFHAFLYAAVGACSFALCYTLVLSKAVNNLVFVGFAKFPSVLNTVYQNAPLLLVLFLLCVLDALLRFRHLSFLELLCYAGAVGGVLAFCLYQHYSFSEVYFLLTALCFMTFPLGILLAKRLQHPLCLAVFVLLLLASAYPTAKLLARYSGNGIQAALNIFELTDDPYDESYISHYDQEAMEWMRDNTPQDAIFATNRNNQYLQNGDGIFHYYTAISQRRCYLESYRYTMDYSGLYPEVRRRLETVSDAIFFRLDEAEAFATAQEEGIAYLVVSTMVSTVDWETTPVYQNEEVTIYACS